MGVASSSLVSPTRTKALMVRLSPYLVEAICELTRALKDKTHAQTEISGLLFGKSQEGIVTAEALKTFKDSSGPRSDLARRERMEKSFTAAMALANEDPEFAAYKLLGWFSLRGGGGLINSDIEFHNRHFKNNEELSLIVWREGDTQITAELYAAVDGGKLTTEDYRWSSVRLSTELRHVSQPVDLVMRVRMNDDLYLRTYGVPDVRERKEEWKKIADSAKRTILALLPGRGHTDLVYPENRSLPAPTGAAKRSFESRTLFRDTDPLPLTPAPPVSNSPAVPPPAPAAAPAVAPPPVAAASPVVQAAVPIVEEAAVTPTVEPAAPPTPTVEKPVFSNPVAPPPPPPTRRQTPMAMPMEASSAVVPYDVNRAPRPKAAPEISGLPMVIPKHRPEPKGTPWMSMALVFVAFSALTFGFMAIRSSSTGDGKLSQIMKVLFPSSDLELRADSHGDSLLLSWNRRNPVVSASTGALLAVTDGAKHFERKLDAGQVANGVVKYTPVSGDVTFQLRVFGADQSTAVGSLRVLDAAAPTSGETASMLDLGSPAATTPAAATKEPSAAIPAPPPPVATPAPTRNVSPQQQAPSRSNAAAIVPPKPEPKAVSKASVNKAPVIEPKTSQKAAQVTPPQPNSQQRSEQPPQQQPPMQTAAAMQQAQAAAPVTLAAQKPVILKPAASTTPSQQTGNTAINGWDPNLPENKPAAVPTPMQQAQQPGTPPDSKTVDFVGPKVLLQVMPNTRNLTPGLIAEVTRVEVEVRVDSSGHVKSAHLTNPNVKGQLGAAAIGAAKQWTFQPATLRGQHVDSDHTIVFEFRPEGQ